VRPKTLLSPLDWLLRHLASSETCGRKHVSGNTKYPKWAALTKLREIDMGIHDKSEGGAGAARSCGRCGGTRPASPAAGVFQHAKG
jgi:hypothetical protein